MQEPLTTFLSKYSTAHAKVVSGLTDKSVVLDADGCGQKVQSTLRGGRGRHQK